MTVEMNAASFAPTHKAPSNPIGDAVKDMKTKQDVRKAVKEEIRMNELLKKENESTLTPEEKLELTALKRQAVIDKVTAALKNMPQPVVMYDA